MATWNLGIPVARRSRGGRAGAGAWRLAKRQARRRLELCLNGGANTGQANRLTETTSSSKQFIFFSPILQCNPHFLY